MCLSVKSHFLAKVSKVQAEVNSTYTYNRLLTWTIIESQIQYVLFFFNVVANKNKGSPVEIKSKIANNVVQWKYKVKMPIKYSYLQIDLK